MSVPPDRMAVRNPAPIKDPNKIMGLPKWAFFVIIAVGLVLAWYIWKRSQAQNSAALQQANAGTQPDTTNGVTAADIGGTPADNSFATQTDATALEEQIQSLQDSLFQLQQSNGGNGAGLPGGNPVTKTPSSNPPGPIPITYPPITGGTNPGGTLPVSTGTNTGANHPVSLPIDTQTNPVGFGSNPPPVDPPFSTPVVGAPIPAPPATQALFAPTPFVPRGGAFVAN